MAIHLPKVSLDSAPSPNEGNSQTKSRGPAPMLSLVKKSGVRTAFDYHLLTRMDFDGDSQLRLQMGDDVVILRGHAIERIFADLLTHTIFEIVEVDPLRNESSDYRHCVAQMEITSFDT